MPKLSDLPQASALNAADLLLISQGGFSKNLPGSKLSYYTNTTPAEQAAGVTVNKQYEPYELRRYGAVGDGVSDDTAAINAWISVCQQVGFGIVYPLVYATKGNHLIINEMSFIGRNFGEWFNTPPEFLLTSDATNLFSFNGLSTAGPLLLGMALHGISFNGNNHNVSDCLVSLQGMSIINIAGCGFHTVVGNGIRLRQFWDSTFRDCVFRNIKSATATGVIVIDSRYNIDNNQNVNNLTIDRCHLEGNTGPWIYSASDSNLNLLRLINSKLESGTASFPAGPLINLLQASNVIIKGNNFDLVNDTKGYPIQIKLGDTTAGSSVKGYDISNNQIITATAATTYLQTQGGTTGVYKDNQQNLSNNVVGSFSNTSTFSNIFELPRNEDVNSDGNQSFFAAKRAMHGYVNVAYLISSLAFITDSGSLDPAQSCLQSNASGAILTQFSTTAFRERPGSLRLGVRCKSATGTGTIQLTVNTSTLGPISIPNTAFGVVWFDVTNNFLSVMGQNSADRFRVLTGVGNADTITIDGVYFEFCSWHYTKTVTYDPPSLGPGATTNTVIAIAGATVGDKVDVYPPYDTQGIMFNAVITTTDSATLYLFNPTATVDLASGSWTFRVTKK